MSQSPKLKEGDTSYLFDEKIDYLTTSDDRSIWGDPRDGMIELCNKTDITGHWLDLGAGDGRYVDYFLSRCHQITALDADVSALGKLHRRYPNQALQSVHHNVSKPLPLPNAMFDGVISTGLLHYFPPDLVGFVLSEVNRVLKPGGVFLFDFSTNVVRRCLEDKIPDVRRGFEYSDDVAAKLWQSNGDIYDFEIAQEDVSGKPMLIEGRKFSWSSRDFQIRAFKKSEPRGIS